MKSSDTYQQLYSWSLVTYHSGSVVSKFCCGDYVSHYAYIKHDAEASEPHYHLLCTFKQRKSLRWIQNLLDHIADVHQNTFGESIKSRFSAYQYLMHENSDKPKYDEKFVVTDKREHWVAEKDEDNRIACILEDLDNHVPMREMALKYGRDFVVNHSKYVAFYKLMIDEEQRLKGCQMEVDI